MLVEGRTTMMVEIARALFGEDVRLSYMFYETAYAVKRPLLTPNRSDELGVVVVLRGKIVVVSIRNCFPASKGRYLLNTVSSRIVVPSTTIWAKLAPTANPIIVTQTAYYDVNIAMSNTNRADFATPGRN